MEHLIFFNYFQSFIFYICSVFVFVSPQNVWCVCCWAFYCFYLLFFCWFIHSKYVKYPYFTIFFLFYFFFDLFFFFLSAIYFKFICYLKSPLFNNCQCTLSIIVVNSDDIVAFFCFFVCCTKYQQWFTNDRIKNYVVFCVWLQCKMAAWYFIYTVHVLFFLCLFVPILSNFFVVYHLILISISFFFVFIMVMPSQCVFFNLCLSWHCQTNNEYFTTLKWHKQLTPNHPFMISNKNKINIYYFVWCSTFCCLDISDIYMATRRSWIKIFFWMSLCLTFFN